MGKRVRLLVFGAALVGRAVGARAQLAPSFLAALQARQEAYLASKTIFASGDLVNGEKTLESANIEKAGTPEWNLESADLLERIAFDFAGRGYAAPATAVAQLALNQLAQAEQKFTPANPAGEVAAEKQFAGQIYEFLIGDRVTAKQYYHLAIQLAPSTSGAAAASLARFTKADAALAGRNAAVGQ